MRVFGSSGVRGVVNEDLTPGDATEVAQAAGAVWGRDGTVDRAAVARDTRATGSMLVDAVTSGLASVGLDVDRLGVVPSPGLQAYAEREDVPGVMVTASHNPPEYNGIKLVGADGVELPRERLEAIETRLLDQEVERVPWNETGESRHVDSASRTYVDELCAAIDREAIADADLTIALDPGHGAGSATTPEFFRRLGCTVKTIHAQSDGHFPGRNPEPVADNLGDLQRFVRATDADLGIAHDGDADRAIFIDERGEYIEGSATLAALAAAAIESGDTVVSAVNASQRLVDVVDDAGGDLSLTPIGSTYIVSRIRDLQATGERVPIAGEGNGGILFPDFRVARDGAYTAARFCELLARRNESASTVVARYDDYVNVRRDVDYDTEREREAMLDAIERTAEDSVAELDTTDGYRLDYGDGWALARPSGTEPVIRIYAEARAADRANELADGLYDAFSSIRVD